MIVEVGGHIFYEAYVAFHFVRESPYAPWKTIGCCLTYGDYADARYPKHPRLRKEFQVEAEEANGLAGTYEFMDMWHKSHQSVNDVVSKPIRYCTTFHDMKQVLEKLRRTFVYAKGSELFGRLAVMLKSREKYFPVVFQRHNPKRSDMLVALREAGYIT